MQGLGLTRASDLPSPNDAKAGTESEKTAQTSASGLKSTPGSAPNRPPSSAGKEQAAKRNCSPSPAQRLEVLFGNLEVLGGAGGAAPCHRLRTEATLDGAPTRQGCRCPAGTFGGPPAPEALARLTGEPGWAGLAPERILYIDTETTGLWGGSSVVAFLVGLGRFEGGRFVLDQYVMSDFDAEAAMLDALEDAFANAGAIVSYNGRTFDAPLLATRWRMNRRRATLPALHLDLLHYARRLWRGRLANCSLGTVERSILGVRRFSDVPGMQIPQIYLDFIAGRHPERIVPVFDHHAQDILSLGALTAHFARLMDEPDHPGAAHATDQWGLGRIHAQRGRADEALARMEAAVLLARDPALEFRMAMHLARQYRRMHRRADAVAIWEVRAAEARAGALDPLVELAKHHEHQTRDLATALRWTQRALALNEQVTASELAANGVRIERERESLLKRLERLKRRSASRE